MFIRNLKGCLFLFSFSFFSINSSRLIEDLAPLIAPLGAIVTMPLMISAIKYMQNREADNAAKKLFIEPEDTSLMVLSKGQEKVYIKMVYCMKKGIPFPGGGVCVYGAPGNGKTLLASKIVKDADAKLMYISPSSLCSSITMQHMPPDPLINAKRIFEQAKVMAAKTKKPVLIFLDEIDFAASRRDKIKSYKLKSLAAQLLIEVSKASKTSGIYLMSATNYAPEIDLAMVRDGRFGEKIEFTNPDLDLRFKIYKNILNNKMGMSLKDDSLSQLAQASEGLSNAGVVESITRGLVELNMNNELRQTNLDSILHSKIVTSLYSSIQPSQKNVLFDVILNIGIVESLKSQIISKEFAALQGASDKKIFPNSTTFGKSSAPAA